MLKQISISFVQQRIVFPEVFRYVEKHKTTLNDMPNIVSQLNVYIDTQGLLRVKCKTRWKGDTLQIFQFFAQRPLFDTFDYP